jgi:hypothetical protein
LETLCKCCWYKQGRNQSTNTLQTCRIAWSFGKEFWLECSWKPFWWK